MMILLLIGCTEKQTTNIAVENLYEIKKDTSVVSYYGTKESIDIKGFEVLENSLGNYQSDRYVILVNDDNIIHCIKVVDSSV